MATRRLIAAIFGVLTLFSVAASPASASDRVTPDDDHWTTIVDSTGQRFSYGETRQDIGALENHFDWTAEFNARLESRHYSTPYNGTHRIVFNRGGGCFPNETFAVSLWYEAPIDQQWGETQRVSCANGGTVRWDNVEHDAYYFVISSSYFGLTPNRTTSGTTYYP
ncbi:hypothetical protein [Goodfellowiella coeruleoviolacea]|uniref:Secreted protein n=1 Tax=Goodfellowiella coeruleoviolacea TaxID=334858 RepID=A0AAE3KFD2_9PSEU|nr:hypothetical protein [Goodfellowiella coeruleoviolacea]MCP2164857.1 hypothetical protein [Goodfellowiella coeruleoviolacea]